MSLKNKPHVYQKVLQYLVGTTGKTERQCKGLINRMSDSEFMDNYLKSDQKPKQQKQVKQEKEPDPEPKRPVKKTVSDSKNMKLYSFHAPEHLMYELKQIADKNMQSTSSLVRVAIDQYLERHDNDKRY